MTIRNGPKQTISTSGRLGMLHLISCYLIGEESTCVGAGESGKSTIFKQASPFILYRRNPQGRNEVGSLTFLELLLHFFQIKLLFQTGFDETELKSYIPVIHANVYQTIKVCNI